MGRDELKKINSELNERIVKNIKTLLEIKGLTYYQLQKKMKNGEKYTISPGDLNKVLNHPTERSMPLAYLMQCCDFFGIHLETMVTSSIRVENYF